MDDLINRIVEKTGVTAAQARDGANMAVAWIKDKLPTDMGDQIGGLLDGAGGVAAGMVDKAKDVGSSAGGVASDAAATATTAASGAWDKTKDAISGLTPDDDS